jgi:hypothetical protein
MGATTVMGCAAAYGISTLLRLPSIQHWDGCTAVEGTLPLVGDTRWFETHRVFSFLP